MFPNHKKLKTKLKRLI